MLLAPSTESEVVRLLLAMEAAPAAVATVGVAAARPAMALALSEML